MVGIQSVSYTFDSSRLHVLKISLPCSLLLLQPEKPSLLAVNKQYVHSITLKDFGKVNLNLINKSLHCHLLQNLLNHIPDLLENLGLFKNLLLTINESQSVL